jgi:hypothetical protein
MKIRNAILVAALALTTTPAAAAKKDFEGHWIRDCGEGTYCRVLLKSSGKSYDLYFGWTSPSMSASDGCDWNAKVNYKSGADTLIGKGGLTAKIKGDKLILSGMPSNCPRPGKEATFERDSVDDIVDY